MLLGVLACLGAGPVKAAAPAGALADAGAGSAAWPLCPVQPRYPLPATEAAQQQALDNADAAMPQCLHSAPYYAWRGALQLVRGRVQEAAESLERALLLDPELPGAQLDYAQALAALGDLATARELLEQLRQRPDLPAPLREIMQRNARDAEARAEASSRLTRLQLSTAWGYDSNLNNAPAASQLTLTLPQGSVLLPLDNDYRPRAGGALLSTAQWQHIRAFDGHALLLSADLRGRATADSTRTGYLQGDFAAQWLQAPEAPSQWMARVAWGRLEFGGAHWLTTQRASLQHQWRFAPGAAQAGGASAAGVCRATLGLDLENRQYPISTELNGRYLGGAASLFCTPAAQAAPVAVESAEAAGWASGWSLAHYGLQLRWGQDHARSDLRPGGRYDRMELSLSSEARLGTLRVGADYSWTRQGDREGYSPLFDNNLRRNTLRHGLRLTVSQPLTAPAWHGASAFVSLEASRQQSNIAAFAMRQRAISAGLRWELP